MPIKGIWLLYRKSFLFDPAGKQDNNYAFTKGRSSSEPVLKCVIICSKISRETPTKDALH